MPECFRQLRRIQVPCRHSRDNGNDGLRLRAMLKPAIGFSIILATLFGPALHAQRRAGITLNAASTLKAFYTFHFSHDQTFSEATLRQRRKWLSVELYDLLRYERRRNTPSDEPSYMEGDPFTNSQEGPNRFRIGKTTESRGTANAEVVFAWVEKKKVVGERKSAVKMAKREGGWIITDIVGDDGQRLVRSLKELKRKDLSVRKKPEKHEK
jgi:hypothetical protein